MKQVSGTKQLSTMDGTTRSKKLAEKVRIGSEKALYDSVKRVHVEVLKQTYKDDIQLLNARDVIYPEVISNFLDLGYGSSPMKNPLRIQVLDNDIARNNVASAIKMEFETYKEIVSEMREVSTRLKSYMNTNVNAYFNNLPKIHVVRPVTLVENALRTYQDDIEDEANADVEYGELDKYTSLFTADNIKESFYDVDPVLLTGIEIFFDLTPITSIMESLKRIKNNTITSMSDIAVGMLLRSFILKTYPESQAELKTLSKRLLTAYVFLTRDIMVLNIVGDDVYLSGKYYDQLARETDPSFLIGIAYYNDISLTKLRTYDDVINAIDDIRHLEEQKTKEIEDKIFIDRRILMKRACVQILKEDVNLTRRATSRMRTIPSDGVALIKLVNNFISKLDDKDIVDNDRISEHLFLDILFENTTFSQFYRLLMKNTHDDLDKKLSYGIIFLATIALKD